MKRWLTSTPLRKTTALGSLAVAACLIGSACSSDMTGPVADADSTRETAMALSVQTDPDIDQMRFTIDRSACGPDDSFEPFTYTHTGALEDLTLPAGLPEFVGQPYDADSEHAFADHYVVLETGCYDISVEPLDAEGNASDTCSVATQNGVEVQDGATTEVVLISQCDGAASGGLDVVGSTNTAPTLTGLVYQPSKFIEACLPNEVCASATDPDSDPLDFAWTKTAGPDASGMPTVLSHTRDGDTVTECIEVTPETAGTYEYELTVYDIGYDTEGNRTPIEELTGEASHDTLDFPIYAGEGPAQCPPTDGGDDDDDDDGNCVEVTLGQLQDGSYISDDGTHAVLDVPANACPVKVSFSSYGFDDITPRPFPEQNLYDNVTDTYGPGTYDIYVELPPTCGWQTDLYLGDPIYNLDPNVGHPSSVSIAVASGTNAQYCD